MIMRNDLTITCNKRINVKNIKIFKVKESFRLSLAIKDHLAINHETTTKQQLIYKRAVQ